MDEDKKGIRVHHYVSGGTLLAASLLPGAVHTAYNALAHNDSPKAMQVQPDSRPKPEALQDMHQTGQYVVRVSEKKPVVGKATRALEKQSVSRVHGGRE